MSLPASLRILAVAETWLGADGDGYVRAFRRLGHSVRVVPAEEYVPGRWRGAGLRALRRLLEGSMVREYEEALVAQAAAFRPHLLFVFKGKYVTPGAVERVRRTGAVAVNFYPDVSFLSHGPLLPGALPLYDWVFTTKTFGLEDMRRSLGVTRSSFLPHAADPDVHRPVEPSPEERERYGCDVSFIGTWSPKKQAHLEALAAGLGGLRLRIFGAQWEGKGAVLAPFIEGHGVHGLEYAKAIGASRVNLCILSEARRGASSGDRITSRTFHIPGAGGFLLHERTDEFLALYREGAECGAFGSPEEMAGQVRAWCGDEPRRAAAAAAGRRRLLADGHTTDARVRAVLAKVEEIARGGPGAPDGRIP
ncbi:MAG: glycosyltransferase [Planctomycetes bacterium]|nr:glycosyltransferase [Planctomycetota bacterium]